MQVMWKKMAQDPSLDPSHPMSWDEPLGETQWSIWVPSDTAELENYAGYIVSCSTWEAKFTYLFNEITTHYFTCNMHNEMTRSTKTEISLSSQVLTILRGQGGSHLPSATRETPDNEDGLHLIQECPPVDKQLFCKY